jgi:Na+/melibiose symporter-like transporter
MTRSLDKKWKEALYAASGFGPNLLMVMMGAYLSDAFNPSGLGGNELQSIIPGVCLITPALFPILWTIAKMFDGLIDVPLANITDTLSTRWGRRRPPIAVCFIPMTLSYALCWIPFGGPQRQLANTLWLSGWAIVLFTAYTMCLISFYGSLSNVCENESQRLRVSSYKAFFDTVAYSIAYALAPLLMGVLGVHIDKLALMFLPIMCTMLIPLFMIKEGKKYGYPENDGLKVIKLSLSESVRLSVKNRLFMKWVAVNCCCFFGMQLFLVSMNAMIVGGMGMGNTQMAILETSAFAPVPLMLFLFNKLKRKKGIRFAYQSALLAFCVGLSSFVLGSLFLLPGAENATRRMLIGAAGGLVASWSIGAFFMMPYMIPAQISSVEEKLTGKNHSAMYFAIQAVTSSAVAAVAGGVVYENIKRLFISRDIPGIYRFDGQNVEEFLKGVDPGATFFNLGTLLTPVIVIICCVMGFFLARRLPRDFSGSAVAAELKRGGAELIIPEELLEDAAAPPRAERGKRQKER